jgi:hypothetical protein
MLNGVYLPETNQYLPNYSQYNISGFSVISTVAGCSEMSTINTQSPVWSGYYFDILQGASPCTGDTVPLWVLHINGFLSGLENILWYKNDTLLPLMTNQDTLYITSAGDYECKVIDPSSDCPFDTTSFTVNFDCLSNGISTIVKENKWTIPAGQVRQQLRELCQDCHHPVRVPCHWLRGGRQPLPQCPGHARPGLPSKEQPLRPVRR